MFLFLLAFALKNTDPVTFGFFLDSAWNAPLIIVVLAFFAGGVLLGVLSLIGTVFSLRRELARLRRESSARAVRFIHKRRFGSRT